MDIRKDHVWGIFLALGLVVGVCFFTLNRHSLRLWVDGFDLLQHLDMIRFGFLSAYLVYISIFGTLGFRMALRKKMNAPFWGAVCISTGILGFIVVLFWRNNRRS